MNHPPSVRPCPNCGAALPDEVPQGLCPKCLLLGVADPTDPGTIPGSDPMVAPSIEALAEAFPQLEVLEWIGQGGMGCVFKARQKELDRGVALKILPESLAGDPAFATRFAREARVLAALNHPNIVTVHDFGRAGPFFYLLMEFVDGVNLRQALRAGRFTPEQALTIVPFLCDALQFAHDRGVVHRDIKPENILLDRAGAVKIADFGIARLLATTDSVPSQETEPVAPRSPTGPTEPTERAAGTPGYMAPEQQHHARTTDHRADIYSLGVVLYEMLTGERPRDPFDPPSRKVQIDVRLDEVVLRALEREPGRRYQQVSEIGTAIATLVATSPPASPEGPAATARSSATPTRPATTPQDTARAALKWPGRGLLATAAATAVVAVVLMVYPLFLGGRWWLGLPLLVGIATITWGVAHMRSLRSHRAALLGVAAGFGVGLVNAACLPFAVWALAVLRREEVLNAFQTRHPSRKPSVLSTPLRLAIVAGGIAALPTLLGAVMIFSLVPYPFVATTRLRLDPAQEQGPRFLYGTRHGGPEHHAFKSIPVLREVIDELGLIERWSPKYLSAGQTLHLNEALPLLMHRIEVRSVPRTALLEIRVTDENPEDAAEIGNTLVNRTSPWLLLPAESNPAGNPFRITVLESATAASAIRHPKRHRDFLIASTIALLLGGTVGSIAYRLAARQRTVETVGTVAGPS
ncbi:MAG: protein kinase [Verrucomicrobiae bacterium]|nr:protein kinase [Verrucomicrobiae bacterium]